MYDFNVAVAINLGILCVDRFDLLRRKCIGLPRWLMYHKKHLNSFRTCFYGISHVREQLPYEPVRMSLCVRNKKQFGFRPGLTQIGPYSHRSRLEA